jgi:Holliday junction resolvase RusA-like endonuclease
MAQILGKEDERGMETWTFVLEEPVMGAVRMTKGGKFYWPKKDPNHPVARYLRYKERVRCVANLAGVPDTLPKGTRITVSIATDWKQSQRADGDNVIKGVLDALWKNDRRVTDLHYTAEEHTGNERAGVMVRFETVIGKGKRNGKARMAKTLAWPSGKQGLDIKTLQSRASVGRPPDES